MQWLTAPQAAHRLGVKPATLYAYVSRGLLHSHRGPDGRESKYNSREVETLARRGRPRASSNTPTLDIRLETRITQINGHRILYRGHDALMLSRSSSFEQVAELIWSGELPATSTTWHGDRIEVEAERMSDRLRLIAAYCAVGASQSLDRTTVTDDGRHLIATMVESLPIAGDGRSPRLLLPGDRAVRGTIAGRLWARMTPRRATPALVATLNAALVILADHEMAASTLAARVAASTRANAHGVVASGMGTLSGPLHGGDSELCRAVLARAVDIPVADAITEALDRYGYLPGFGQRIYPQGDPRAAELLGMLRGAVRHPALDLVDRFVASARRRSLPPPNVDLALAALGMVGGMPSDAGEAIFTIARIVGWLAHALEEYDERPLRFRARADYVG